MSNYARFDRGEPEGAAEIDVNDADGTTRVPMKDTHIEVDSPSETSTSQIQFYRTETSTSGQEYVEDPGIKTTDTTLIG